jgi:Molybdopterin-binding domain of aldehyde dehydrogenase
LIGREMRIRSHGGVVKLRENGANNVTTYKAIVGEPSLGCLWNLHLLAKLRMIREEMIQRPGWGGQVNLLGPAAADPEFAEAVHMDLPDHNGGSKNAVALYDFPQHVTYEFAPDLPFRLSALRSLGAFANVFAIESFMDELAELAGCDPVEFRLRHLADPRASRVVNRVAAARPSDRLVFCACCKPV